MALRALLVTLAASLAMPASALALPLEQGWDDTGLILVDDDWSGVAGIVGHRGDGLTADVGADPQTIVGDGASTPVDVLADRTSPNTLLAGGIAELELADPAVALQPSETADAPHLVLSFDTMGFAGIKVSYLLRDLDGSEDDALQPVALQYRVGASGDYVNVAAGFVADATTGPELAELVTPVEVALPPEAEGRPLVQVRVVTANAGGSDEWVGVDDIVVAATAADADPPALSLAVRKTLSLTRALRHGVPARVTLDERAAVRLELRIRPRLARRLRLPAAVGAARVEAEPGKTRVPVRFRARARHKLSALQRVRLVLRAVATDTSGNLKGAAARLTLRR
jgi:hypothetical protein